MKRASPPVLLQRHHFDLSRFAFIEGQETEQKELVRAGRDRCEPRTRPEAPGGGMVRSHSDYTLRTDGGFGRLIDPRMNISGGCSVTTQKREIEAALLSR